MISLPPDGEKNKHNPVSVMYPYITINWLEFPVDYKSITAGKLCFSRDYHRAFQRGQLIL